MKALDILKGKLQENLNKVMIVDKSSGSLLTYKDFLELSLKTSTYLKELGFKKGDRIGFLAENSLELSLLYFGCMHLGIVIVPINPSYNLKSVLYVINETNLDVFFTSPKVYKNVFKEDFSGFSTKCIYFHPQNEHSESPSSTLFLDSISNNTVYSENLGDVNDEDIFLNIFTSGTTAKPKGVEFLYKQIIGNGLQFCAHMKLDSENRFYNNLPMTYLGGLYNLLLIPILAGGSIVLDDTFGTSNIFRFWETVSHTNVNTLWFNSTILSMLMQLRQDDDEIQGASKIKIAMVGMAPLPIKLKTNFEKRYGFILYENYGISETTFITSNQPCLNYKHGSVGKALSGVEVLILDKNLKPVDQGVEGEVYVKSPFMMNQYIHASDSDKKSLFNGGFLTGDLGKLDSDSELFITGRIKDIIIRGGINVSPKAIEDLLYELPEVKEAASFGLPNDIYGEEIFAAVSLKEVVKESDLLNYCKRKLSSAHAPKKIFIFKELPKGATGKIHKGEIKNKIRELNVTI